jgi:hypothetical protein
MLLTSSVWKPLNKLITVDSPDVSVALFLPLCEGLKRL